jgi:hypothetical protein
VIQVTPQTSLNNSFECELRYHVVASGCMQARLVSRRARRSKHMPAIPMERLCIARCSDGAGFGVVCVSVGMCYCEGVEIEQDGYV